MSAALAPVDLDDERDQPFTSALHRQLRRMGQHALACRCGTAVPLTKLGRPRKQGVVSSTVVIEPVVCSGCAATSPSWVGRRR